jgi:hypothetical protein
MVEKLEMLSLQPKLNRKKILHVASYISQTVYEGLV